MSKVYTIWLSALLLGGCSLAPNLEVPSFTNPKIFDSNASTNLLTYWKSFHDSYLDGYIEELFKNNYDLKEAALKIDQARASLKIAVSDQLPSLEGTGQGSKTRTSNESYPVNTRHTYENYALSGILSYELDLFGRVQSTKDAASAVLSSAEASAQALRISLIATLAESYFSIISLEEQKNIAQETLNARESEAAYREKEYGVGSADLLTLHQANIQVETAKIALQNTNERLELAKSAFKELLGSAPSSYFEADVTTSGVLPDTLEIPKNLPSDILERRPDVKAALESLKATNALVGVARSAYFPTISLSGALGYASTDLNNLAQSSASVWNYGGALAMPLLNFGKTSGGVESAESQKAIAALTYEKTLKSAFREVKEALVRYQSARESYLSSKKETELLEKTQAIVKARFENGYSSYLELLDAERMLYASRIATTSYKQNALAASITLYKALGGGWEYDKED